MFIGDNPMCIFRMAVLNLIGNVVASFVSFEFLFTFQVIPSHGNPQLRRTLYGGYLSNIVPLNSRLFTKYLRRYPSKHIRTKNHLKSFPDVSKSHKTSTNLSVRAYFRRFSDSWERQSGHSQESPGSRIFLHVSNRTQQDLF